MLGVDARVGDAVQVLRDLLVLGQLVERVLDRRLRRLAADGEGGIERVDVAFDRDDERVERCARNAPPPAPDGRVRHAAQRPPDSERNRRRGAPLQEFFAGQPRSNGDAAGRPTHSPSLHAKPPALRLGTPRGSPALLPETAACTRRVVRAHHLLFGCQTSAIGRALKRRV